MPISAFFDFISETSFLDLSLFLIYPSLFSYRKTVLAAIVVSYNKT